jgi:hypothetical protein
LWPLIGFEETPPQQTLHVSSIITQAYEQRVYNKMWPNFRNHYWLQKLLGERKWLINGLISFENIPFIKKQIPKVFY